MMHPTATTTVLRNIIKTSSSHLCLPSPAGFTTGGGPSILKTANSTTGIRNHYKLLSHGYKPLIHTPLSNHNSHHHHRSARQSVRFISSAPYVDSSSGSSDTRFDRRLIRKLAFLLIKLLPLKIISRIWGWINSIPLPVFLRIYVIQCYSLYFGCDLEEAEDTDLKSYQNLGQFFRRSLKPGLRPINPLDQVVSPADGTVVHFGRVDDERIEQVKGVNYSLRSFLGPQNWTRPVDDESFKDDTISQNSYNGTSDSNSDSENDNNSISSMTISPSQKAYHQKLLTNTSDKTCLYHCVIYLAPGDYHRFHSPAEWTVDFRRHFSGKLISIRPSFMSWIEDLFTLNERVAYFGRWAHGFFSMTAVGATNVGSVRVYFDEKLQTNSIKCRNGSYRDQVMSHPVKKSKGDAFGEFNLGSTIVLIFEGPKDFECTVEAGSKVKYGQKLFQSKSVVNNYNNSDSNNRKFHDPQG